MPNDSLKYLEKHEKSLLFPIFRAKAVFALKVWEIINLTFSLLIPSSNFLWSLLLSTKNVQLQFRFRRVMFSIVLPRASKKDESSQLLKGGSLKAAFLGKYKEDELKLQVLST